MIAASHASLPLHFAAFPFFSSLSLFFLPVPLFSLSVLSLSQLLHVFMCAPPSHPPSPLRVLFRVPRPTAPHAASLSGRQDAVRPSLPSCRSARRRARSFARPHPPHLDHLFISHATRERTHRHESRASTVQLPLPSPSLAHPTPAPAQHRPPAARRPPARPHAQLVCERSPPPAS